MKKYLVYLFAWMMVTPFMTGCNSFEDLGGAQKGAPLDIAVKPEILVDNLERIDNLKVKFDNYEENLHYVWDSSTGDISTVSRALSLDALESIDMTKIVPGIYTITISGVAYDKDGTEYYISGSLVNKALFGNETSLDIPVKGLKISPLVFKEIYYCGSEGWYFRDQFYEIYNNSSDRVYLDGIYFTHLYPTTATTSLPVWPSSDGDKYVYTERVWKFPGNGTDYPLEPGESVIISQFAANHTLDIYNPLSPVDCTSSEFEFNMNNPNYPDQPAPDMVHVYYQGYAEMEGMQYLTSVFGAAYAIFQVPEGVNWDPVNDPNMRTVALSETRGTLYAKIPVEYILDAVEAVNNASLVNAKRLPGLLDAGCVWVGQHYSGKGVARKRSLDENGEPMLREETGTYIYQDTNNSTEDFELGVTPMLRRHDAKMPSWNHTLQ